MLFRRRKPDTLFEKIKDHFWPRKSLWRSVQYMTKRILRLTASPHAIAAGVAAGVFVSFTPFLGFHIIIAGTIAYLIGGNLVASTIATGLCNPLTFPFMCGATLGLGRFMLHGSFGGGDESIRIVHLLTHLSFAQLWKPILEPMAVGSVPIGLLFAVIFYFVTRSAANAFREQRRRRLAERARRRAAAEVANGFAASS